MEPSVARWQLLNLHLRGSSGAISFDLFVYSPRFSWKLMLAGAVTPEGLYSA